MNERLGPLFLRMGIILAVIVAIGLALSTYFDRQGDALIERERKEAARLGWIKRDFVKLPPPTSTESAYLGLEMEASKLLPARDRWPSTPLGLLTALEPVANLLLQNKSTIDAIKSPISSEDGVTEKRASLAQALSIRGEQLAAVGRVEEAAKSFELALALANIHAVRNSDRSLELDNFVRKAWLRAAGGRPELPNLADSVGILGFEKATLRRFLVREYSPEGVQPGGRTLARREVFERLRFGNRVVKENEEKMVDLETGWTYLRDGIRTYRFEMLTPIVTTLSAKLKLQWTRNQITRLFSEARRNGGMEPAGLAKSKDPFNNLKPLKFRTIGNGFAIYSVGEDGVDGKANKFDLGAKFEGGTVKSNLMGFARDWK